jgi:hypothetical protein
MRYLDTPLALQVAVTALVPSTAWRSTMGLDVSQLNRPIAKGTAKPRIDLLT